MLVHRLVYRINLRLKGQFFANYDAKVFVLVDTLNCLVTDNQRGDNCRMFHKISNHVLCFCNIDV